MGRKALGDSSSTIEKYGIQLYNGWNTAPICISVDKLSVIWKYVSGNTRQSLSPARFKSFVNSDWITSLSCAIKTPQISWVVKGLSNWFLIYDGDLNKSWIAFQPQPFPCRIPPPRCFSRRSFLQELWLSEINSWIINNLEQVSGGPCSCGASVARVRLLFPSVTLPCFLCFNKVASSQSDVIEYICDVTGNFVAIDCWLGHSFLYSTWMCSFY